jgi:molecular chaperone DnaK (HSP70)
MAKVPGDRSNLDIGGLNLAENSDSQLIIGIDFGTTFSAIAYIFKEQGKADPEVVTDWPGTEGYSVPKTPTLLDYDVNDRRSFTWGSKVDPTSKGKLEGIKLLLDPDQPTPLYVPATNTRKNLLKLGKTPVDVASDYIGALYRHALAKITLAFPKDYVEMQQKKFVVTVPAVWSDKAKDLTLKVRWVCPAW